MAEYVSIDSAGNRKPEREKSDIEGELLSELGVLFFGFLEDNKKDNNDGFFKKLKEVLNFFNISFEDFSLVLSSVNEVPDVVKENMVSEWIRGEIASLILSESRLNRRDLNDSKFTKIVDAILGEVVGEERKNRFNKLRELFKANS